MTALLLAGLVLLSACGRTEQPAEDAVAETPAPTASPAPDWSPATVRADDVGALYTVLNRGDEVSVLGAEGDYYRISLEGVLLYAPQRYIRTNAPAPEVTGGYTQCETQVYATAYLTGEPLKTLAANTPVTVLDSLNGVSCIRVGNATGYVPVDSVGGNRIETEESSGGTSAGAAGNGTAEGDGLSTVARGCLRRLSAGSPVKGFVFTDGLELYACIYQRGDGVQLVTTGDGVCTVLAEGLLCTIPAFLLTTGPEPAAETAYALPGAVLYGSWRLNDAAAQLPANTELTVLDKFGGMILVRVNGAEGYLRADGAAAEPTLEEHTGGTEDTPDDGGTSADGVWTDPVL